jgi:hypothetical protein
MILSFLFLINFSCQSKQETTTLIENKDTLATAIDTVKYPENLEASSFPNGELIHERGLLKNAEDSGYPIVTITIEFPDRNFEEMFILNLEEVKNINQEKLSSAVGKYVDFGYTSDLKKSLLDIQVKSKSIFDTDVIAIGDDAKMVKGILKGADEVTGGDLPGIVTITNKSNEVLEFEFFITEEMVRLNGKMVTAFYEERTVNQIVEIAFLK